MSMIIHGAELLSVMSAKDVHEGEVPDGYVEKIRLENGETILLTDAYLRLKAEVKELRCRIRELEGERDE